MTTCPQPHIHREATEDDYPLISSIEDAEYVLGITLPRDIDFYKDGVKMSGSNLVSIAKRLSNYESENPKIVSHHNTEEQREDIKSITIFLFADHYDSPTIISLDMTELFKVTYVGYRNPHIYLPEYGKWTSRHDYFYFDWNALLTFPLTKYYEQIEMPQGTKLTQEILDQYWQKRGGRPTLA